MKKQNLMRISILSIAFLATSLLTINAQTVVGTYGRLQVTTIQKGNNNNFPIVGDENGNPISLGGMSLFWSNAGDSFDGYTSQTVNHLVDDWDIAIIRAAMGVKEDWDNGNGYVDNPQGQMVKIRNVIDAAIAKGIYVIVDYHTHNAENYKTEAITFFKEIATLYGNNDNIIYEIFNEPIGDYDDAARRNLWNNTIKPYAEDVIDEIRNIDPDNLIVVGTPYFDQGVDIASENQINDNNVAYALHFYAGALFNGNENTDHTTGGRQKALTALGRGAALFVTEWGTVDSDGAGSPDIDKSNDWFDFMEENHISHANWAVSDKNEGASVVNSGQGIIGLLNNQLTETGNYVRNKLKEIAANQQLSTENFTLNGEQISLFPNPATDILNLETSKTNITSVKIVDMQGRQVLSNDYNSLKASINVSSLSKGIYIMEINNTAGTQFVVK